MESLLKVDLRRVELEREAPICARSIWKLTHFNGVDVAFLCGTIGAEFDVWQRRLSIRSSADAYLAQQIGLNAVEKVMDELEEKVRAEIEAKGGRLLPRRSPGYGELPLLLSRTILRELDAARQIGVSITDSDLLVPSKSVTAICKIC